MGSVSTGSQPLGTALPCSAHAVAASMPAWADVVGYEEGDPRVVAVLQAGYPRFVFNGYVAALFQSANGRFGHSSTKTFCFPSRAVAERCSRYVAQASGVETQINDLGQLGIWAVTVPAAAYDWIRAYWMHSGEIVSSRAAQAVLSGEASGDGEAKLALRNRIGTLVGAEPTDVFLCPTGMAAVNLARRALVAALGERPSIQFGFPYVDLVKSQQKLGFGCQLFAHSDEEASSALHAVLAERKWAGLFTEVPSNPLLESADIPRLSDILQRAGVPLVVDDSISGAANVKVLPWADIVVSSLTKYFSGGGDVMGGSLVLNRCSPLYEELRRAVVREWEDLLFDGDAQRLEENSRDYVVRAQRVNETAEALCEYLTGHPGVAQVHFPKYDASGNYRRVMRESGRFGGVFSILLKNASERSPVFYDRLDVAKGPGFGTNFTLACPVTLLAHYQELEWAEACGVSRWLIRVAVGLEPLEVLKVKFEFALAFDGQ